MFPPPEHGLAAVDLAAAGAAHCGVSLGGLLEHGEGAEVLGVVAVGDAGQGVVVPVEEARLDGRLEPGEDLHVAQLARLGARLAGAAALVGLDLERYAM